MERKIATFQELLDSLPEEQKTKQVIQNLKFFYDYEVHQLNEYEGRAKTPSLALFSFVRCGNQYIADFWAKDLALLVKDEYNWHLQNTSQWLYAGCILVQDGEVSTHH